MSKAGLSRSRRLLEARRLLGRARNKWREWRGTSGQIYFEDRIGQYRSVWGAIAADLGAEFHELDERLWEIRKAGKFLRFYMYQLELDNPVVLELAGNKPLVHRLLANCGLQVPAHLAFSLDTLELAESFLQQHPAGIVIKPASGYAGKGVTTGIREPKQIQPASILASLYSRELLAEKEIPGECFRLLVFRGRVLSAVRRTGTRVRGDGRSTAAELVAGLNGARGAPGSDGASCERLLKSQGLTLDSVIDEGREVVVSGTRGAQPGQELRTVYDCEVLADVAPETIKDAVQAAQTLRSDFLGVDIITPDIGRPLAEVGGVINEVNTTPALHHHYDSKKEPYPGIARDIVAELLDAR